MPPPKPISQATDEAALLRGVIETAVDGILVIDEAGTILTANLATSRIFGYTTDELVGSNIRVLMPEPDRSRHDGYLARYFKTGERKIIGIGREVLGLRKDGSKFPLELAVGEVQAEGRRLFTGIIRDITDRKRTEQALRQSEEAAREADRRKDEFLAMLAHELRNPLTPMRFAVPLLETKLARGEDPTRPIEVLRRQIENMSRIVDDLLDVARVTRGAIDLRRERLDLADIVRRAVDALSPRFREKALDVSVDLPDAPLLVVGDPVRLEQVVVNLLANAAKYTDARGRIAISAKASGTEIELHVRDTGIGLTPSMLGRVFNLFEQAERALDRSEGGLGIGLTVVKTLVDLHGGRVTVSSPGLGQGSDFVVRLPAALPQPDRVDAATPGEHAAGARLPRPRRVLVVDDNRDAADLLNELLTGLGHEVKVAYDGHAALDLAEAMKPDLVLLDIGLPGIDGYEIARRLRRDPVLHEVEIVAVTGYGQPEDRRRAIEAGFDEHLLKPVQPAAIVQLLDGE